MKVLLDSGASSTIIQADCVKGLPKSTSNDLEWITAAGPFKTNQKCKVTFALTELSPSRTIEFEAHVAPDSLNRYHMIIGRDLLRDLGIVLDFGSETVIWDTAEIPMKETDAAFPTSIHVQESKAVQADLERLSTILDAKYQPADLDKVVKECSHLQKEEQVKLRQLLERYKTLFDGTLGKWKDLAYDVELKEDAKPYHARPYPIPKAYEQTLKMEVDRLCRIGVLRKVNRSEWAAPTFIIPKKDRTVRFISDFRELNKRIKRKPFPIPKIQDLLLKLEGFQYGTSLDLNMGYYHIELSPNSKRLCTIVLPWGKYEYQKLPMGLCNSPDIFQEKMSELMLGLEFVRCYLDDLLVLTSSSWDDHLDKLERVLQRLQAAGLKINANKSFFGRPELEYLGHWVTREGIKPMPQKIQAIQAIKEPKNKKQLRSFIGLVNYYRDMWIRRSHVLTPLTQLVSNTAKWVWTAEHQKAFTTIKRIISREVLLAYPQFDQVFDIHTDASRRQLGAVISQGGRPIAFYSRKLNQAQTRYTTTERELLAIVETLKEFRNILLGQQIRVYTDHKNLTYKAFNTDRVMRWRLIVEEYSPELHYVKGSRNIVADALSRLELATDEPTENSQEIPTDQATHQSPSTKYLADAFGPTENDLPNDAFPLTYKLIQKAQQADTNLLNHIRKSKSPYLVKPFRGGGKVRQLLVLHDKIVIPKALQHRVVQWYHTTLCHPGETRTEMTIRQHFTWKNLREDIRKICGQCPTCQLTKRHSKKYGKLPPKEPEEIPWDILCVDLIGPYTMVKKGRKKLTLWCVTMIDPATGWFEIAEVPGSKSADRIANIVEQTWLTRYPRPQKVILDRGKEFLAEFAEMMRVEYGIKRKPITVRNPQANSIIERIHQTIGNMIRTFRVNETYMDSDDPWSGLLSAVAFATRATIHTTLQATPMQLVFGRDAILNVLHDANWRYMLQRKKKLIHQNNQRENAKRQDWSYHVGDKVIIKNEQSTKYGTDAYSGPYTVTKVNDNGTVRISMGVVSDTFNIRNVHPYQVSGAMT